ncbi:DEAD-box ATP-dependent RNA helicase 5 isoform X1 [Syzygium oleosum]|uniref:DEAD-box ATP-dependent RNA helicase 5 isoform X1 n=1 Tax=Syzygium oleosum TaxID=219896 RepID=UPI0024BBAA60|nr:DEAD-box ATP-dependent RNA helicase 5 isoform X1 [Syzygium oleosum]
MGRKLMESSTESESSVLEEANVRDLKPEQEKKKKDKKKKKDRNGDSDLQSAEELNRSSQKRKEHGEDGAEADVIAKKKKKKKRREREAAGEAIENGGTGVADYSVADGKDEEVRSGNVVVSGRNVKDPKYSPVESFADAKLPEQVLECCKGFAKPSPIQSRAWPFLLDGRDFIGIAATGSGKTLAFGVPAVVHVLGKRKGMMSKGRRPLCLVLSPTRELAQQISDVLVGAGKASGVKSVCVYGGTPKEPQRASMKSGVDIVIGTPGRLKDLIEEGVCSLNEVAFVVLDEADRMLDMGFEPEVRSILSSTCSVRQTVMFSATWPLPVHQLAQEFMDPNPIKVVIGSEDLAANHDVMQIVEVLDDRSRDERLVTLLQKYHSSKSNRVLVFVLYKNEASRVEQMLQARGWNAVSIHGDKKQHQRTMALQLFKKGTCPLMIATDVAARGLDIPDVEVVINYSFPLTTEDYVHRIGRTGRAGNKGVAHTFFTKENKGLAGELVNVLREAGQVVPASLLKFGTHVKKKESKLYGAHFREITADAPKAKKITFDNSDDED